MNTFELTEYLAQGIENLVKRTLKATLSNPKESIFISKYSLSAQKASKKRRELEDQGLHIPPFLIASITTKCNLHCIGCYSRANNTCHDANNQSEMTVNDWQRIFHEARDIGIGFIILVGGEPMLRRDIIEEASKVSTILFPVFTNGTMFNKEYMSLFDKKRNLMPIFSIEGDSIYTDLRRGKGTYQNVVETMQKVHQKGIVFGNSITVTKENLKQVTSNEYINRLRSLGSQVIIFVEYVPVDVSSMHLAPTNKERNILRERQTNLRKQFEDIIFISFPGDEKEASGCLAAGRGFFHINALGGAEPCPFSPYSDMNLKHHSMKEVLQSPLFKKLQDGDILIEEHVGGCVLFEKEEQVIEIFEK